jgi:hypothetical protein
MGKGYNTEDLRSGNEHVVNTNLKKMLSSLLFATWVCAAKYLPETVGHAGRVIRFSAFGMLSRLYLAYWVL